MRIDLHLDTLWKMSKYGYFDINQGAKYSMVDRIGLKEASLDAGVFALYLPKYLEHDGESLLAQQVNYIKWQKISGFKIYLALEGGRLLGDNESTVIKRLNKFAKIGITYLTLTHNYNTFWADSATDIPAHGGLSSFGLEVIKLCNKLGVLVDISHTSDNTTNDAIDVSVNPVIASHSGCRALLNHPRNLSDEIIKRIAIYGGVIGVPFVKKFVGSIGGVANHIDHIVQLVGNNHVAIGSDMDGAIMVDGIEGIEDWNVIVDILIARGYDKETINKIMGKNIERVFAIGGR